MRYKLPLTAMIFAILFVAKAPAQWTTFSGFTFNNPMSSLAATMVLNRAREDTLAKRLGAKGQATGSTSGTTRNNSPSPGPPASSPPLVARKIDETQLRFRPDPAASNIRSLADHLGSTQAERDQYFTIMNAVIDAFEKQASSAGKPHDVALALSYSLAENARIYHGQPEISDSQFMDLRNMIAQTLSDGGALKNSTDGQKQEMYETLAAYAGINQFGRETALKDSKRDFASAIHKIASHNSLTVTKMSPDWVGFAANVLTFSDGTSSTAISSPEQGNTTISNTWRSVESISVTPQELSNAFSDKEVGANGANGGELVRVSRRTSSTSTAPNNSEIRLNFPVRPSNNSVVCDFNRSETAKVGLRRRSNKLGVEGSFVGYKDSRYQMTLENCTILWKELQSSKEDSYSGTENDDHE